MTDKQIIIDKLKNDVACKENIINHLSEHNIKLLKQLKRKEQELEVVCKTFDIEYVIDEETGNLFGRCNKLYKKEQECEELKEKIAGLLKIQYQPADSCKKYVQTFAEIKEIAEAESYLSPKTTRLLVHKILQKISECEVENEKI